ncbi:hypothetical protein HPB47_014996, partial [Ixodes persulcatus]
PLHKAVPGTSKTMRLSQPPLSQASLLAGGPPAGPWNLGSETARGLRRLSGRRHALTCAPAGLASG